MSNIQILNQGSLPGIANIEFVQGNTGGPVGPDPGTHIINIVGNTTQGIHVGGNAGTFTETITADDATTAQKGVVLLATNAETIAGAVTTKAITPDDLKAKLGAQTQFALPYGNLTTGVIQWLGVAGNGQLPIGSVGAAPVLGNITSLDGSIIITNGPGTIDLSGNSAKGTVQTVGAVTNNLITFTPALVAGIYKLNIEVVAYDNVGPTSPTGCSYYIEGCIACDGVGGIGTLGAGVPVVIGNLAVFNDTQVQVNIVGGNVDIDVTGLALETIRWTGTLKYLFGGA